MMIGTGVRVQTGNSTGTPLWNSDVYAWTDLTTGVYYDMVMTGDGTGAAGGVKIYIDGTLTGSANGPTTSSWDANDVTAITLGRAQDTVRNTDIDVNEFLIYNDELSAASIAAFFTGASRTEFASTTALNATEWTDPGVANVLSGTSYVVEGSTVTGTYTDLSSTDPGVANVLSGTTYVINNNTLTGTYHDPTYTDPGVANVLVGTEYVFNDATLTGTFDTSTDFTDPGVGKVALGTNYLFSGSTLTGEALVATIVTGTAQTVNIGQLKQNVATILEAANTTTGSPIDLSANLATRVNTINRYNPEVMRLDHSRLPAICIYTDRKDPELDDIARNMATGKRRAKLTLRIAGLVWSTDFSDASTDPADDELEILMENIERVLRSEDTLFGQCRWHVPKGITYHTAPFDEETAFRVGLMDLEIDLQY